jgi:hypothetical protein
VNLSLISRYQTSGHLTRSLSSLSVRLDQERRLSPSLSAVSSAILTTSVRFGVHAGGIGNSVFRRNGLARDRKREGTDAVDLETSLNGATPPSKRVGQRDAPASGCSRATGSAAQLARASRVRMNSILDIHPSATSAPRRINACDSLTGAPGRTSSAPRRAILTAALAQSAGVLSGRPERTLTMSALGRSTDAQMEAVERAVRSTARLSSSTHALYSFS